jgi:hypothetical protein
VFGTGRAVPQTYVQRADVDDRFLNDITRDKHIVVHGSSKQGKTSLRKYHLKDEDYIVIQCTREATKPSLYEMLLKHAGIKYEVSDTKTVTGSHKLKASVGGEGGVPLIAKAKGEGGYEHENRHDDKRETIDFEIDPNDANDVARVLEAAAFKKFIVVEDFHYLDEEVQRSFAVDLKVFHEISPLVFIIVGVWLEANRLILYNGDLTGRIATINADDWKPPQLKQVVTNGEKLLTIEIPELVKDFMVYSCQGNVGLLQEVCYRLCEKYDVWTTQKRSRQVGTQLEVEQLFRSVAEEQSARYRNFLSQFAEGLGKTELEMYKWIAYAVVTASAQDLRRGMKPSAIFHRVKDVHPNGDTLQQNNVRQALENVGKVQFKHKLQPLIFDYSNGELKVVDANFLVFVETHTREELLEYIGVERPPASS